MKGNKTAVRLISSAAAVLLITAAIIIDGLDGISTPVTSILGGYASIALCTLLLWRCPAGFHICAQVFVILAMGMGSILNLYDIWPGYDRIVHFLSGVIIYFLAPFAVYYFAGNTMSEAITLLRILTLFIFCGCITTYLGTPVLVSFGYPKPFNMSVILSTVILLFLYV